MAQQMRISLVLAAFELEIPVLPLILLARDLGIRIESESITPEEQVFLREFQPLVFCTRREAMQILGVNEKRMKLLLGKGNLKYEECHGQMKFRRETVRQLANDYQDRQRRLIDAPRRVHVSVQRKASVAENATVATAMAIEDRPRQTTGAYVLWMLMAMLALALGAIVYNSIWGPPPPG